MSSAHVMLCEILNTGYVHLQTCIVVRTLTHHCTQDITIMKPYSIKSQSMLTSVDNAPLIISGATCIFDVSQVNDCPSICAVSSIYNPYLI